MAFKIIIIVCFIICGMIAEYQSAKILMLFTIPSLSNHLMYRPIIDSLASRNHSIVVVTTDPSPVEDPKWNNVVEIDVHDISYAVWTKHFNEYSREVLTTTDKLLFIKKFGLMSADITRAQLSSPAIKNLIKSEQSFDVVMGSIMHLTNLGVAKKFGAPFVAMHPSDVPNAVHNRLGNSFANSYYPDSFYPRSRPLFTLGGIKDRYNEFGLYSVIANTAKKYDETVYKHLNIATRTVSLLENTDLLMLTTAPIWSVLRPVRPNTLFLGNTRLRAGQPLTTDLQEYLHRASQGVIYFSLGSNLKSSNLSKKRLEIILATMKTVPYKILFKCESDNLPNLPSNVLTAPWFPQQDILAHPNVKAFVTHGGLLSISEALFHEVPMVVIPFFGDQHFNAMRVKNLGIGEVLNYKTMTAKDLENAIVNACTNNSFMNKIAEISDRLFDQPSTAVDSAVWWVEYLIRHKSGSHFQHPRISTVEYLMIDIICVVTLVLVITVVLVYVCVVSLVTKFYSRNNVNMSKRFTFAPQKSK